MKKTLLVVLFGVLLSACQNNAYPYLYWSGNVTGQSLSKPNKGWIIEKSAADDFFVSKLKSLGLTNQESTDFRNYWVTKIETSF